LQPIDGGDVTATTSRTITNTSTLMLYFITENYLKTNTPITANVDVTDVFPYVATQAQLRVMPILGTVILQPFAHRHTMTKHLTA
jgi:hypothetical protein